MSFSRLTGDHRFLESLKGSEKKVPVVRADASAPLPYIISKENSGVSAPVLGRQREIAHIKSVRDVAEIGEPVVGAVTVDVVYFVRVGPMNKLPDYAVRKIGCVANTAREMMAPFFEKGRPTGV